MPGEISTCYGVAPYHVPRANQTGTHTQSLSNPSSVSTVRKVGLIVQTSEVTHG